VLQALFLQISAINYFEEVFVADKSIFANLRKKVKKVIKTYKDVFANIDQKNHKCFVVFTQMDLNKDELDGYKNCKEQLPTKFTISIQESVQRATSYAIAVMEYIVNINKKVDIEKQPSKDLGSVINRFNDFDRIEGYLVTNHPLSESYYKDIKQWVSDCKAVFESIEDDLDNMDSYALFSRIFGKMPAIYEALEERFPSNVEESCQQYRGNHIDLLFYRLKELNALCKKYYELQLEQ
jgi:hypothetical protein